jgi:hypothetical protein
MTHTSRTRIAALLAVLALATAACSTAAADDSPGSTTAPPTTEAPAVDEPSDEVGETPTPGEPETTYRPIEVEGDLPFDGHTPGGGELIAVDGNKVTVGFWMGVESCYGVQRIDVAETETKVAVDITVSARSADQVCIELAEARSVTVELDAPLGGRILEIGGAPVGG